MKKFLKIGSIFLVLAMLVCVFTSCGKEQTISEVFQTVSEFEGTEFETTIVLNTTSPNFYDEEETNTTTLKLSGKTQGTDKIYLEISGLDDENATTKFTDVYLIGRDVYINMYAIMEALDTTIEADGELLSTYETDKHYVKINLDEVAKDALNEEIVEHEQAYTELFTDVSLVAIDTVKQAIDGVEPPVYTVADGVHTIKLTNANLEPIIHNIATILPPILDTKIDELITKYTEKGEQYQCNVDALTEFKENELEDAKLALEELKDFKFEEGQTNDMTATFKLDKQVLSFDLDSKITTVYYTPTFAPIEDGAQNTVDYTTTANLKITGTITENKSVVITAPTDTLTDEELQELMNNDEMTEIFSGFLMTGLKSGYNDSFSTEDFMTEDTETDLPYAEIDPEIDFNTEIQ